MINPQLIQILKRESDKRGHKYIKPLCNGFPPIFGNRCRKSEPTAYEGYAQQGRVDEYAGSTLFIDHVRAPLSVKPLPLSLRSTYRSRRIERIPPCPTAPRG
jgi:hypothetical protein